MVDMVFLLSITGEGAGEGDCEGDRCSFGDRGSPHFIEGEIGEESVEGTDGCAARADQRAASAARPSGRLAGRRSPPFSPRCGGSTGLTLEKGLAEASHVTGGLKRVAMVPSTPETASRKESRKRRRTGVRTAKNRSP